MSVHIALEGCCSAGQKLDNCLKIARNLSIIYIGGRTARRYRNTRARLSACAVILCALFILACGIRFRQSTFRSLVVRGHQHTVQCYFKALAAACDVRSLVHIRNGNRPWRAIRVLLPGALALCAAEYDGAAHIVIQNHDIFTGLIREYIHFVSHARSQLHRTAALRRKHCFCRIVLVDYQGAACSAFARRQYVGIAVQLPGTRNFTRTGQHVVQVGSVMIDGDGSISAILQPVVEGIKLYAPLLRIFVHMQEAVVCIP